MPDASELSEPLAVPGPPLVSQASSYVVVEDILETTPSPSLAPTVVGADEGSVGPLSPTTTFEVVDPSIATDPAANVSWATVAPLAPDFPPAPVALGPLPAPEGAGGRRPSRRQLVRCE